MIRLLTALLIVVVLMGLAPPAAAQEAASVTTVPAWYYVTARPCLNLRSGPAGSYRVLECMPANRIVRVRSLRASGWARVYDPKTGALGWAAGSYLKLYHRPAAADPPPIQLCWDTTFNWTACAPLWIAQTIVAAADAYGVPRWAMLQLAACESAFDPAAQIGEVFGLYQFRLDTMAWIYPGGNVWSVSDSSYAAAKLLSIDPAEFDCAWRIGYI